MNAKRRKAISKIIESLENAQTELEWVKDEETEAMENMPESLQGTERYETMETAVDALETAFDSLMDVIESLGEIVEG